MVSKVWKTCFSQDSVIQVHRRSFYLCQVSSFGFAFHFHLSFAFSVYFAEFFFHTNSTLHPLVPPIPNTNRCTRPVYFIIPHDRVRYHKSLGCCPRESVLPFRLLKYSLVAIIIDTYLFIKINRLFFLVSPHPLLVYCACVVPCLFVGIPWILYN